MNQFCEKCGNEIKPEDKYCKKCGNGVNGTTTIQATNNNPYFYRNLAHKSLAGHFLGLFPFITIGVIILSITEIIASISGPDADGAGAVMPIVIFGVIVFLVIGVIIFFLSGKYAIKMYSSSKKEILELGIEEQRKFYDYKKKAHLYIGVFIAAVTIANTLQTYKDGINIKLIILLVVLASFSFIGCAYNAITMKNLNKENKKEVVINNEQ